MSYIYVIANKINSKVYIGKTIDLQKRWTRHKYFARKGIRRHLYNAMRRYGVDQFVMSVVEECEDAIVNDREKYWISHFNSMDREFGYNRTSGGDGGNTWELNQHKDATRELLSRKLKGHAVNREAILQNAEKRRGAKLPEEQKIQISKTLKEGYSSGRIEVNVPPHYDRTGSKHTDAVKAKLSLCHLGKSYETMFGVETAAKLKLLRQESFTGSKNPNHRAATTDDIVRLIKSGYKNNEIAQMCGITTTTIWNRLKSVGQSAKKIREENLNDSNV